MRFRNVLFRAGIVFMLLPFAFTLRSSAPLKAANLEGFTYHWNEDKQRWLVAPGATVTAYHQGQQCGQTVSDHKGWYNVCVTICCQQGRLVRVEATYQGMSDYFETEETCDKILRHDFFMDGWHKIVPPGH